MVGIEGLATRATLLENGLSIHVFGRYSRCQKQGHEDSQRDAFQQEIGVLVGMSFSKHCSFRRYLPL